MSCITRESRNLNPRTDPDFGNLCCRGLDEISTSAAIIAESEPGVGKTIATKRWKADETWLSSTAKSQIDLRTSSTTSDRRYLAKNQESTKIFIIDDSRSTRFLPDVHRSIFDFAGLESRVSAFQRFVQIVFPTPGSDSATIAASVEISPSPRQQRFLKSGSVLGFRFRDSLAM